MACFSYAFLSYYLFAQVTAQCPSEQRALAAQGAAVPASEQCDSHAVEGTSLIQVGRRSGTLLHTPTTLQEEDRDSGSPHRRPRVGVLLGYDRPDGVRPGSFGAIGLQLARHWAGLHNYTLFVEPHLGRLGSAPEAPVWDKIAAMRRHLPEVDVLFWLDLDVLIVDPSRTAEELLKRERGSCARTGQAEDDAVLASQGEDIFLWAATSEFVHIDGTVWKHSEPSYRLNLCAGAFALKNDPRSFRFLDAVWGQRHNPNWPAEQGAVWNVLLSNPELLSRTCVLPEDQFVYESLEKPQAALARSGPFAIHATGYKGRDAEEKRNAIGRAVCDRVFSSLGGCPEPALAQT